jgi:hypothetical protein
MTLETEFIPPEAAISQIETQKRREALGKFVAFLKPITEAIMLTGSLAYGSNYAVKESSDVDLQILVTRERIQELHQTLPTIFTLDQPMLLKALSAFQKGLVDQFSLSTEIDGITMESHFWEKEAYVKASTFETQATTRIRLSNSRSTDYSFGFDGQIFSDDLPTSEEDGIFISTLPSYRIEGDKMTLCRPVANALSNPEILHGADILQPAIDKTWKKVAELFAHEENMSKPKGKTILNALPGKYKMSPEVKALIENRFQKELSS